MGEALTPAEAFERNRVSSFSVRYKRIVDDERQSPSYASWSLLKGGKPLKHRQVLSQQKTPKQMPN